MEKISTEPEATRSKPAWLQFVIPVQTSLALLGTGVGGMLHFLNVGEGSPEYQMFVMRVSAFVILLF